MICPECRGGHHGDCPELARQLRADLRQHERAGSPWCDCEHQDRAAGPGSPAGKAEM